MNKKGISGLVIWTISRLIIPTIIILLLLVYVNRELGLDQFTTKWKTQELRFVTEVMQSVSDPMHIVFSNDAQTEILMNNNKITVTEKEESSIKKAAYKKIGSQQSKFSQSKYIPPFSYDGTGSIAFIKKKESLFLTNQLPANIQYPEYSCSYAKATALRKDPFILIHYSNQNKDKKHAKQLKALTNKTTMSNVFLTTSNDAHALKKQYPNIDLLFSFQCHSKKNTAIIIGTPQEYNNACGLWNDFNNKNIEIKQEPLDIFSIQSNHAITISYPCAEDIDITSIFSFIRIIST